MRSTVGRLLARLAVLLTTLLVTLSQRTMPTTSQHIPRALAFRPAPIAVRTNYAVSGDLSAAVRIHRGDKSMVVLAVTPLSQYWERIGMDDVPPLGLQLDAVGWNSDGTAVRFEPLRPLALGRRTALAGLRMRLMK